MRTLNHMLLIMAAAGLVSWYASSAIMYALVQRLTPILWALR